MTRTAVVAVVMALVALAGPGMSMADAPDGTLRFFASSVNPTGDMAIHYDGIDMIVEADAGFGFGASYEFRTSEKLGYEVGLSIFDADFIVSSGPFEAEFGSALMLSTHLGVNYHFMGSGKVDLYAGPQIAWTQWGDLESEGGVVALDSDFGFGAVVGVDVSLGSSAWAFSVSARYLTVGASDGVDTIDVDPFILSVGFARSF